MGIRIERSNRKKFIIAMIANVVSMFFVYWFLLWPISVNFIQSVLFFEVFFLISYCIVFHYSTLSFSYYYIIILFIIVDLLGLFMGTAILQSNAYYRQLGEVKEVHFDDMITEIDTSQIPIVDYESARKIAEKKLGEEKSLGSRVKLGDGEIQEINGEIKYVFPLEHSGFFKWLKNRTTPGYITISASNTSKVNFVKGLEIKYQNSAFFSYNLKRHLRFHGCLSEGLTEYTFEISDDLVPYWVVTTYKNSCFWGLPEATGVAIVNAETGELKKYSVENTPDWVDIVQPKEFVSTQIDNYGKYVHGIVNFSDTDKVKKTPGVLTVYNNGDCYYFTGITSVGANESVDGFMMINTRNKKVAMANLAGATETAAMTSAEGLLSDYGYEATVPLPINVNGVPTYAVALKDKAGLIKSYAMINVENFSIGASGASLSEASTAYMKAMRNAGVGYIASDKAFNSFITGNILRIGSEMQAGDSVYYIILDDQKDKLFEATFNVSNELSISQVGDRVNLYYIDDGGSAFSVIEFDNLDFSTLNSENQESMNIVEAKE